MMSTRSTKMVTLRCTVPHTSSFRPSCGIWQSVAPISTSGTQEQAGLDAIANRGWRPSRHALQGLASDSGRVSRGHDRSRRV